MRPAPASPNCPRCGAGLARDLSRDHLKPKVCPAGHGVFLEADELAVLFDEEALETLRRAVDVSGFGDAACPRCASAMRAFPFTHLHAPAPGARPRVAGIEADGCATCGGMWFDAGEVEPVVGESFAPRPPPGRASSRPPQAEGAAPKPQGDGLWRRIGETVWDLLLWTTLKRIP